jgi:hypothetical protein
MDRRAFLAGAAALLAAPLAAEAQQPEKLYRIGMPERTSTAINGPTSIASDRDCGTLDTSRGNTSSSSTDRPTAATTDTRAWRLSWFG